MNKATVIGNLTRDPQLRTVKTSKGDSVNVCDFTVAVNDGYGERKSTTYFRATAWRGLAEVCAKYLRKSSKVYVAGPIAYSQYVGTDNESHVTLEIRVDDIEFLSPARREEPTAPAPAYGDVIPATPMTAPTTSVEEAKNFLIPELPF